MVIEQRSPAIPAVRRFSIGPGLTTIRRNAGNASLQRPCSARASAFSAVIALVPEFAGAFAAGGRFCDCCAKRELADSADIRQQMLKPIFETRKFRTLNLSANLFDVGTKHRRK